MRYPFRSRVVFLVALAVLGAVPAAVADPPIGAPFAWGSNFDGALGAGVRDNGPVPSPVAVSGLTGVLALSAGGTAPVIDTFPGFQHGLALASDRTVSAWGNNGFGQLGNGTEGAGSLVPVPVTGLSGVVAVEAGSVHSLALKSDGTVMAWGYNGSGALGDGTTTSSSSPVAVTDLGGIVAIAAGGGFNLALRANGTVMAWGYNVDGALGDGTTMSSPVPVPVSGLGGVTAVSAGHGHSLARANSGAVWAWGANDVGQLGDGSTTPRSLPSPVTGLGGILAISAGANHNLALRANGTVMAWGHNGSGELGRGDLTPDSRVPAPVSGLSGVSVISAGYLFSLAVQ